MTEQLWNWQTKVNRLRTILDENAPNCTFDVAPNYVGDLSPVRTMININVSVN